jgi:hypothetical protein
MVSLIGQDWSDRWVAVTRVRGRFPEDGTRPSVQPYEPSEQEPWWQATPAGDTSFDLCGVGPSPAANPFAFTDHSSETREWVDQFLRREARKKKRVVRSVKAGLCLVVGAVVCWWVQLGGSEFAARRATLGEMDWVLSAAAAEGAPGRCGDAISGRDGGVK